MNIFWQNKIDYMLPGLVIWNETMHIKKRGHVASFPGSNTLEHEHWSCAGVEYEQFAVFVGTT